MLKLPVVFQHFMEHRQEDKSISLIHFLAIHYLHGSPKDKDYDRDMQLPFKTSGDLISVVSTPAAPLGFSIDRPVNDSSDKNFILSDQYILSSFLSNIWQPPRTS